MRDTTRLRLLWLRHAARHSENGRARSAVEISTSLKRVMALTAASAHPSSHPAGAPRASDASPVTGAAGRPVCAPRAGDARVETVGRHTPTTRPEQA
jgi:hypothetical protein